MKRGFAMMLMLAMLWSVTACGGSGTAGTAGPSSAGNEGSPAEELRVEYLSVLPTAEELGREPRSRILMIRDGRISDLEAVLCIREAFSLYIPAEGWEQEGGEAIWHAAASPRVRFGVLVCPGADVNGAAASVQALLGEDYTFGAVESSGAVYGRAAGEGCAAQVRTMEYAGGTLAFWSVWSEDKEGEYAPVLTAVAATLRPVTPADSKDEPAAGNAGGERVVLELMIEGMPETVPATRRTVRLFDEGFSLCVFDEGWKTVESETAVALWQAENDPQVQLWVSRFYPSGSAVSEEDCRQAVARAMGDFQFSNLANGTFYGVKPSESLSMQVWLCPAEGGFWTVFAQYPDEVAEGYGVRMAAMAATFRCE